MLTRLQHLTNQFWLDISDEVYGQAQAQLSGYIWEEIWGHSELRRLDIGPFRALLNWQLRDQVEGAS